MNKISLFVISLFVLGTLIFQSSCRPTGLLNDGGIALRFSTDTLAFDTVFTQMGTATRSFKIYNPYDQTIRISHIHLGGGTSSPFRLNVDGLPGADFQDIEIAPNDSIYLFANAYIDPLNSNSPLVVEDSVMFELNGGLQKVRLFAYGQDANYIGQIGASYTIPNGTNLTFANDKPYIIMGQFYILNNSSLTIQAGCRVHMFGGPISRGAERAAIVIGTGGRLDVQGTYAEPVKFISHRIDSRDFQNNLALGWEALYFTDSCQTSTINYAEIQNAVYGILAVGTKRSPSSGPQVILKNTKIHTVSQAAVLSLGGYINAENCLFYKSDAYVLTVRFGGQTTFNHCTMLNRIGDGTFNPGGSSAKPVVTILNYAGGINYNGTEDSVYVNLNPINYARFTNCIIYDAQPNTARFDRDDRGFMSWSFDNCLVRADSIQFNFRNSYKNLDPKFEDQDAYDFRLDSIISPAYNTGVLIPSILTDLDNNPRVFNSLPDIGAYELQE